MKVLDVLQRHAGKPHMLQIARSIPETANLYGFILAFSQTLALVHVVEDWHLDGYQIIRISDITSVRHRSYDKSFERILKAEGVLQQFGLEEPVDLRSWQAVFRSLKMLRESIIVEDEDPKTGYFAIGQIKLVSSTAVRVLCFDGHGIFDAAPYRCVYTGITLVRFRCEYVNVFSKYTRKKGEPIRKHQ